MSRARASRATWASAVCGGLSSFLGFPFLWMISTAFKASQRSSLRRRAPATGLHFGQPGAALRRDEVLTYLKNSLTSPSTVALRLPCSSAAYSLTASVSRVVSRSRPILFTYMFAPIMIIVPFYVLMRFLGLTNTHSGSVLAYTAFCLPFSIWMLRAFFQSIPIESSRRRWLTARIGPDRPLCRASAVVAGVVAT